MPRQFEGTPNVAQGIARESNPLILQNLIAYSENIDFSRVISAAMQRGAFIRPAHADFTLVNSSFKAMGNMAFLEQHPEQLKMKAFNLENRVAITHGAFPQPYSTALSSALGGDANSFVDYEVEPANPSQVAFTAYSDISPTQKEVVFIRYQLNAVPPPTHVWDVGTLFNNSSMLSLPNNRVGYPFRRQGLIFEVNTHNAYIWQPRATGPTPFANVFTDGTYSFAQAYGRFFSMQRDTTGNGEDNLKFLHYTGINSTDWNSGGSIVIAGEDRFSGLAGNGKLLYAYGPKGVYFIDPSAPTEVGVVRLNDLPVTIDNAVINRDVLYCMSESGLYSIQPNGTYQNLLTGRFREQYETSTKDMLNPPEIRPFKNNILFPVRLDTITTNPDLMGHHDDTIPLGQWMNGIMVYNTQFQTMSLWTVSLNSFDTSSPYRLMGLFGKRSDTSANVLWYDKNTTTDFDTIGPHTAVIETKPFTIGTPFNKKGAAELRMLYEGKIPANSVKIFIAKNAPATHLNSISWGTPFKTLNADTTMGLHLVRIPLKDIIFNTLSVRIESTQTDPRNFILLGLGIAANVYRY